MTTLKEKIRNVLEDGQLWSVSDIAVLTDSRKDDILNFMRFNACEMGIYRSPGKEAKYSMRSAKERRITTERVAKSLNSCPSPLTVKKVKDLIEIYGEVTTEDVKTVLSNANIALTTDQANKILDQVAEKLHCKKKVTLKLRRSSR